MDALLTRCSLFVLMIERGSPDVNSTERSQEPDADAVALLEAEVDEAIAICSGDARAALRATLAANAYLEAEVERLTEAVSTGFTRGPLRKPATKSRR
jgi:hypothetical protein